jgi:hypothetical protein
MNKTIGLQLVGYGLLLAGLSYLTHYLAPSLARTTLITGLIGGAFCFVWGLMAMLGKRRKVFSMLTLIPVCYVLLGQAIMTWTGQHADLPGQWTTVLVITVLFALSLAMLMRIAYAGAFDGQTATPTTDRGAKTTTTGKPAVNANKRA